MRINITLAPKLYEHLEGIMRERAFSGPAEYLAARVRQDAGLDKEAEMPATRA